MTHELHLVGMIQPDGGFYGTYDGNLIADQMLWVFDGVSDMWGSFADADGDWHAIPVGWYPAGIGASEIEGLLPLVAFQNLDSTVGVAITTLGGTYTPQDLGNASIGERLNKVLEILSIYITETIVAGSAAP